MRQNKSVPDQKGWFAFDRQGKYIAKNPCRTQAHVAQVIN